ncbi:sulfite exporter TauE/SafE family protein [Candidatus Bathyarchaeota archaeon]|nr:sulfite exporter TauE/SafE family protein [Candidatus Bathyarchaeota archaeon]
MSLLPEISNPYVGAFAVGLLYGTVFCTSTCLPYIASYIAGIGADFRKGVIATLIYNMGRVIAYALIGGLVGIFSGVFRFVVSESSFSVFQQYSAYGFGIVTIIIGVSILLKSRSTLHGCNPECNKNLGPKKISTRFDVRAFSLGFSRGLIVCPYLVAILLLYSIPFAAPIDSFVVAVLFGLGTALSPMLLLGGVTGWLLNKAPLFRKWIAIAGGGILVVLGAVTLVNAIIFPIM